MGGITKKYFCIFFSPLIAFYIMLCSFNPKYAPIKQPNSTVSYFWRQNSLRENKGRLYYRLYNAHSLLGNWKRIVVCGDKSCIVIAAGPLYRLHPPRLIFPTLGLYQTETSQYSFTSDSCDVLITQTTFIAVISILNAVSYYKILVI